jgi:RHS repeat-associated protein
MKKILIHTLCLFSIQLFAQLTNHNFGDKNYIYEEVLQVSATESTYNNVTDNNKIRNIVFFDGLGRKVQSRAIGASPSGKDIVHHVDYDILGRINKEYLPFVSSQNDGFFESNGQSKTVNYYNTSKYDFTTNPYSDKRFDSSPLNRLLETGAPGASWAVNASSDSDHTIKMDYVYNTEEDQIRNYKVTLNQYYTPTLKVSNSIPYYPKGSMYKTIVKNENWTTSSGKLHTTEKFTNVFGQTLLKRTFAKVDGIVKPHDTYYVYNLYNNLSFVVTPKASDIIMQLVPVYPQYNFIYSGSSISREFESEGDISLSIKENDISVVFNEVSILTSKFEVFETLYIDIDVRCNLSNMFIGYLPYAFKNQYIPNAFGVFIEDGSLKITNPDGYQMNQLTHKLGATMSTVCGIPTYHEEPKPEVVDALVYQNKYDKYNRLIEKKVPGKEWEYMVYDQMNRPILTQDALQRAKSPKEWLFTKYDAYGNIAYTGLYKDNRTREQIQAAAKAHGVLYEERGSTAPFFKYTNKAYPTNIQQQNVYTIHYYDDYDFDKAGLSILSSVYGVSTTNHLRSLPTGKKERILNINSSTDYWITTVTAYDDKARVLYTASKNSYLNATDTNSIKLDFMGKILESETEHNNGTPITIKDKFSYDTMGRMISQKQTINTQAEELIVKNTYDELGQVESKKVGNTESTPLQTINYQYNIRGWLTNINDVDAIGTDLFSLKIHYNTSEISGSTPLFNGNISETLWRTTNTYYNGNKARGYSYKYDALNRITSAGFKIKYSSSSAYVDQNYGNFNLKSAAYDKNGNIKRLIRSGNYYNAEIDNLTYNYDIGNKLMAVRDDGATYYNLKNKGFQDGNTSGNDYDYDDNGNLTQDLNKGISLIEYNHLDLPTKVHFGTSKRIEYLYTAGGQKIEKKVINGSTTTTHYAGAFIYENNTLKHFSQSEGYVEKNNGVYEYVYQYVDHQGNIRINYNNIGSRTAPSLQIKEENHYYPFGLKLDTYIYNTVVGVQNNYKYNGKELQNEVINDKKLQWYDYGARNYDPSLGRFFNVDPLGGSSSQIDKSLYAYAWNNPINMIDPDGMHAERSDEKSRSKKRQGAGGYYEFGAGASISADGVVGRLTEPSTKENIAFVATMPDGTKKVIPRPQAERAIKKGAKYEGEVYYDSSRVGCCGGDQQSNGGSYVAGEGNITPTQFANIYSGKTENQIMTGNSSFLGYNYPNDMANRNTRFVMLGNGKEVDMIHFMVVGRAGHALGFANELQQGVRLKSSAFNPQDIYSNILGVKFFNAYGSQISKNPTQISNYINQYFNSPGVLNPQPFRPQFPTGPKF